MENFGWAWQNDALFYKMPVMQSSADWEMLCEEMHSVSAGMTFMAA